MPRPPSARPENHGYIMTRPTTIWPEDSTAISVKMSNSIIVRMDTYKRTDPVESIWVDRAVKMVPRRYERGHMSVRSL